MSLVTPPKIEKLQKALHVKAKEEPEFRFYQLYDKMYRKDILVHAYALCRANGGAAGVDGEGFEAIESEGREGWLGELRQTLKERFYRVAPVRRVWIPKANGGQRPLGIPTIYDRVCQQAILNRLEPIFEPVFDEANFGYRRGRSTKDALTKIWRELEEGNGWVVDADLKDFLDVSSYCPLVHEDGRNRSG